MEKTEEYDLKVYCDDCEKIFEVEDVTCVVQVRLAHGKYVDVNFYVKDNFALVCPECGNEPNDNVSDSIDHIRPSQVTIDTSDLTLSHD